MFRMRSICFRVDMRLARNSYGLIACSSACQAGPFQVPVVDLAFVSLGSRQVVEVARQASHFKDDGNVLNDATARLPDENKQKKFGRLCYIETIRPLRILSPSSCQLAIRIIP